MSIVLNGLNGLKERPELAAKATLIADMVNRSLEMSIFKQAERDMLADAQAQELLAEVQTKEESGEEIDALLDRLEGLDVVKRFTIAQEGVSEVVTRVTRILQAVVSGRADLVAEKGACACCPAEGCSGTSGGDSCAV